LCLPVKHRSLDICVVLLNGIIPFRNRVRFREAVCGSSAFACGTSRRPGCARRRPGSISVFEPIAVIVPAPGIHPAIAHARAARVHGCRFGICRINRCKVILGRTIEIVRGPVEIIGDSRRRSDRKCGGQRLGRWQRRGQGTCLNELRSTVTLAADNRCRTLSQMGAVAGRPSVRMMHHAGRQFAGGMTLRIGLDCGCA
jgi:hypothetical protein